MHVFTSPRSASLRPSPPQGSKKSSSIRHSPPPPVGSRRFSIIWATVGSGAIVGSGIPSAASRWLMLPRKASAPSNRRCWAATRPACVSPCKGRRPASIKLDCQTGAEFRGAFFFPPFLPQKQKIRIIMAKNFWFRSGILAGAIYAGRIQPKHMFQG
jgi:hypothetical protein